MSIFRTGAPDNIGSFGSERRERSEPSLRSFRMRPSSLVSCLLVGLLSTMLAADEWPQFRGSLAGVAADDPALPDTWSTTRNVAWKADIPGIGWSSPVVWGDHVFLTTVINS